MKDKNIRITARVEEEFKIKFSRACADLTMLTNNKESRLATPILKHALENFDTEELTKIVKEYS